MRIISCKDYRDGNDICMVVEHITHWECEDTRIRAFVGCDRTVYIHASKEQFLKAMISTQQVVNI